MPPLRQEYDVTSQSVEGLCQKINQTGHILPEAWLPSGGKASIEGHEGSLGRLRRFHARVTGSQVSQVIRHERLIEGIDEGQPMEGQGRLWRRHTFLLLHAPLSLLAHGVGASGPRRRADRRDLSLCAVPAAATRRGKKRAILAVAHSMLVMAYHMIQRQEPYHEAGADFCDRLQPEDAARHLVKRVKRLEHLGYHVTLQSSSTEVIS
jgi:hypothetical protein